MPLRRVPDAKRQRILDFYADYERTRGFPPSIRATAEALEIPLTTMWYYVRLLEDVGDLEIRYVAADRFVYAVPAVTIDGG